MKTKTWLVLAILGISVLSIVVAIMIYYSALFVPRRPTVEGKDLFGIVKIYQTKEGGREWYVDMENPFSDDLFSSTFERNITRQEDGSWRVSGPAVRLNVGTPSNAEVWKKVGRPEWMEIITTVSLPFLFLLLSLQLLVW